jgi:hypothetical protein
MGPRFRDVADSAEDAPARGVPMRSELDEPDELDEEVRFPRANAAEDQNGRTAPAKVCRR